jgi:hypothetical protein
MVGGISSLEAAANDRGHEVTAGLAPGGMLMGAGQLIGREPAIEQIDQELVGETAERVRVSLAWF